MRFVQVLINTRSPQFAVYLSIKPTIKGVPVGLLLKLTNTANWYSTKRDFIVMHNTQCCCLNCWCISHKHRSHDIMPNSGKIHYERGTSATTGHKSVFAKQNYLLQPQKMTSELILHLWQQKTGCRLHTAYKYINTVLYINEILKEIFSLAQMATFAPIYAD